MSNKRITRILAVVLLSVQLLFSLSTAGADPLDDAKRSGSLGEKPDGYLGLVDPKSSPAAKDLMNQINAKRREEYRKIAQQNKTDLHAVELLAGEKAIAKTPTGQFVQLSSGEWKRK